MIFFFKNGGVLWENGVLIYYLFKIRLCRFIYEVMFNYVKLDYKKIKYKLMIEILSLKY